MKRSNLLIILAFSLSNFAFALVDYTEDNSPVTNVAPVKQGVSSSIKRLPKPTRRGKSSSKFLSLSTSYKSLSVNTEEQSGKVGLTQMSMSIQTAYNIFLNTSYYQATAIEDNAISEEGNKKGNPMIKAGVNWLKLGSGDGAVLVDLLAGVSIGQKDSSVATKRTDKIVGIQTSKRFGQMVFGLGYDYTLTGNNKDSNELDIGNIGKITTGIGWVVSPDIRFSLEASMYNISADESSESSNALTSDISFSVINPEVQLSLAPSIGLSFGAELRGKRAKASENLSDAKLYAIPGIYGNSMYASLAISI